MAEKNKKLFGKINIIDFIVIIVLILAVCVIGVSKLRDKNASDRQTLIIKYYAEEVRDNVASRVKPGDNLYDYTDKGQLGTVTDVQMGEAVSYAVKSDGTFSAVPKAGYSSIIITGEVEGLKTDLGATVNSHKYGVGHSFTLYAGEARIYLRVYDIQVKE